jgi:hypothetical protein
MPSHLKKSQKTMEKARTRLFGAILLLKCCPAGRNGTVIVPKRRPAGLFGVATVPSSSGGGGVGAKKL